jgi:hypothetical protein
MRAIIGAAALVAVIARGAAAQNEGALRAAFEGKTVSVKIDMPATSQGVDVYPQDAMPINFRDVAQRMKDNGTALKMGQQVMVTKVVVKKDHLEFQLGGGGYGTFGDWMTNGSDVSTVSEGETQRERDLRAAIKSSDDKDEKKRLQRELDSERAQRQRENSKAAAEAAQANIARESSIRAKRAESGSRFNLRYRQGVPPEALTPDGVIKALAQYVDFPGGAVATATSNGTVAPVMPVANAVSSAKPSSASGVAGLKKGQSLREVEALLGPAFAAAEVKDGSMTVQKRTYRADGMEVTASFVAGVLIDFAIKPA